MYSTAPVGRAAVLLAICGLVLPACRDENPGSVARAFVDHAFVRLEREQAAALATGEARRKLQEEERLLAGMRSRAEERPQLRYQELSRSIDSDRAQVDFLLRAEVREDPPLERHLSVLLRRQSSGWRVVDFEFSAAENG